MRLLHTAKTRHYCLSCQAARLLRARLLLRLQRAAPQANRADRYGYINRNVPKEKTPRKALSKMSKAQIRRFRAPALLFSYLLSEKLIQRLAILTFPFRPTVRTCTEDEHSGRARRRKRHRFVQHIFAVYIGHVSVFQS